MRRAALPALLLALPALLAAAPSAASAEDLSSLLAPPPGPAWQASSSESLALEDVVNQYRAADQAGVRSALRDDGFSAGWEQRWTTAAADGPEVDADVLAFSYSWGSANWFSGAKSDYSGDSDLRQAFATPGLPNAFGYELHSSDGTDTTVVGFYRGSHYFELDLYADTGAQPGLLLAEARAIYRKAPDDLGGSSDQQAFATAAEVAGLVLGGLVGIALVIVALVIWRTRPRRLPASPPLHLSPDGRWYWDGREWRPVRPPASPGP